MASTYVKGILPVLFKNRATKELLAIAVHAEKRVNKRLFAEKVGVRHGSMSYASEVDVLRTGFPLGGIAPFAFPEKASVRCFADADLKSIEDGWIYCGAGDNTKTLKVDARDLVSLLRAYEEVAVPWPDNAEDMEVVVDVRAAKPRGKRKAKG